MSDEAAFTVTLKHGEGFDAPWTVIRGDSGEELAARLRDFKNRGLAALVSETAREAHAVYRASGEFEVSPVDSGQQSAPARRPAQRPARQSQSSAWPPGVQPRHCQHGEMVYKEGTKRNGDPWAGAFCPAPKNDPSQCDVQWLRVKR